MRTAILAIVALSLLAPAALAQTSSGSSESGGASTSPGGSVGRGAPIQTPSTRTGKNALDETVTDCMKLWEPATHMSKADWQRTCRRVQGRIDQATKQVLGN